MIIISAKFGALLLGMSNLIVENYNVAGLRYTSCPTVPYWDNNSFSLKLLKTSLIQSFNESNEDLIVRKHILNLMCNFKTSWRKNYLYIKELPEICIKLKEMEADGLL